MNDPTDSTIVSIVQPPAEEYTQRTVTVDFLYLDNESCDRCMGTEDALETALERVAPILDALDVAITVRDIHVSTLEAAKTTQLAVSPTIRIDGQDIQPDYLENTCESCGEFCACEGDVDCRLWRYRGDEYTTAPVELLVESLVQAVTPKQMQFDGARETQAYQLSSNVKNFFTDTEDDTSECGCDC
ncbi:DUF2703 domain-containing protein [Natronorubrum thiooxidans]|uniref:Uncharacterized protein n=1 Tax=Natronorubrum thiooxidans TaxID=308853 RepID=A0A1N7GMK3_9EURY|nr:DUF2703 domain-containing protein [Natronorubrum thiooxidans]SIS13824.1 protein of unknown function [Natronorubrum thiooxidans]